MNERIAIVGMAAAFPGAPDLGQYHTNLREGFDAITPAPQGRWDELFHDPGSGRPDRLYCRRGGFLGETYAFDPAPWGIMPLAAEGTDPDQLLTLDLAARALEDAGIEPARVAGEGTGVILGRGGYLTPGMVRLEQFVRTTGQLELTLRTLIPDLEPERLQQVLDRFQRSIGFRADSSIGLVPNLAASRVANRLDFNGPAYTVDAACASSLLAVEQACTELQTGRCDTMLAGGVHLCNDVLFWSVFTQLGALSRSEQIRPFDRRADGLLIGEGGGIVVLRRLSDAERDGNPIHAVLCGVGVASDGRARTVMNPRSEGQQMAIQRAWDRAGLDPQTVGFVEAHGTATPAGDEAELETLARIFGTAKDGQRAALGSVKSMIGHTMPAAGIAGLIKAALAVSHGEIYPSLHCEQPNPLLEQTRFRVPQTLEEWSNGSAPRRAGVSAFGFGGINAHAVLEQHLTARPRQRATARASEPLFLAAADSISALLEQLKQHRPGGAGSCRVAVFDPTSKRLARAARIVERGRPWHGRGDMYFSAAPLAAGQGKVVFLFPGIETDFEPRVDALAQSLGMAPPPQPEKDDLGLHGLAVVTAGRILEKAVRARGIKPDAIAGHSIGEWTGMVAAGMVPPDQVDAFIEHMLGLTMEFPDVVFAALGCGTSRIAERVAQDADLFVSHDNCPHQSIVCGPEARVRELMDELRGNGVLCQMLPFRSGFHAPFLAPKLKQHQRVLQQLKLQRPVLELWSATRAAPYPKDPEEIRTLAGEHLTHPVRFRELTEALYEQGARVFVQMGAGSLTAFVEDTLRGREHLAISAGSARRDAVDQLSRVEAAMWVEGFAVNPAAARPRSSPVALRLGSRLVQPDDLPVLQRSPAPAAAASPAGKLATDADQVLRELAATMDLLASTQQDIQTHWQAAQLAAGRLAPREHTRTVQFNLQDHPALIDHSFFRQPPGWDNVADRFPVVPMTMHLELMLQAARELVPERRPVGLENVRAYRWLAVLPPVETPVTARFDGDSKVTVTIGEFSAGTVVLADAFAPAPAVRQPRPAENGKPPITAESLYTDRWMFHGPAYHTVTAFGNMAEDGINGQLTALPATGALLDGAGQLTGYWIVAHTDRDRLAFPVKVDRIDFYGEPPAVGENVDCRVWVREAGDLHVTADLDLLLHGQVWARITGWTDRRFETDTPLYQLLRYPESSLLAEKHPRGFYRACEHWNSVASRELIARRVLRQAELAEFHAKGPRSQRGWLLSRIAAKDAVRDLIWTDGQKPMFPIEVWIRHLDSGRPVAETSEDGSFHVSLSHKQTGAVAIVSRHADVGIDLETIEERGDGFAEISFSAAERELLKREDQAEWLTRGWAAKEAYAKSVGTGLEGRPQQFGIQKIDGERLWVTGPDPHAPRWIETVREGDEIIAFTPIDEPPRQTENLSGSSGETQNET